MRRRTPVRAIEPPPLERVPEARPACAPRRGRRPHRRAAARAAGPRGRGRRWRRRRRTHRGSRTPRCRRRRPRVRARSPARRSATPRAFVRARCSSSTSRGRHRLQRRVREGRRDAVEGARARPACGSRRPGAGPATRPRRAPWRAPASPSGPMRSITAPASGPSSDAGHREGDPEQRHLPGGGVVLVGRVAPDRDDRRPRPDGAHRLGDEEPGDAGRSGRAHRSRTDALRSGNTRPTLPSRYSP